MKYIDLRDLKTKGKFLKAINFKPKIAPLMCLIVGMLLFIPNNLYVRLIGLVFIIMSFIVFRFVKDYKVIDIFDEGVLIYNSENENEGMFIEFDDIQKWAINHQNGHDTIEFTLNNGKKIIKDSFEVDRAYRLLYNLIKEKEERYIQAQKNKELQFNIPDALNNIKKNLTNKKEKK